MATSGTAVFDLNIEEVMEEAFERCGLELRSGRDVRTARRSINLMMSEWANQGLNLWTVDEGSLALVAGTATYSLPADTVDLIEHQLRVGESDYTVTRMSVSEYAQQANKATQGRPSRIYINRTATPTATLWPVPNDSSHTLRYWRLRRMEDAGTDIENTLDLPHRFLPAFTAGLAYSLAQKNPARVPQAIRQELLGDYNRLMTDAKYEDRDRSSVIFSPDMSGY